MKTNCGLCCVHHRQVQWVRPQIALVEHERNQLLILPNSTFHIQGDGRWSYGEPKTPERKRHSPVFRCVWIPRPPVPCLHRNLKLQSPLQIDDSGRTSSVPHRHMFEIPQGWISQTAAWLAIPKPMSMHFQQLPCKKNQPGLLWHKYCCSTTVRNLRAMSVLNKRPWPTKFKSHWTPTREDWKNISLYPPFGVGNKFMQSMMFAPHLAGHACKRQTPSIS